MTSEINCPPLYCSLLVIEFSSLTLVAWREMGSGGLVSLTSTWKPYCSCLHKSVWEIETLGEMEEGVEAVEEVAARSN